MLGNLELAEKIADTYYRDGTRAPKGFKHIGSGGTRSVYLGPDGVAYKVGSRVSNLAEARAAKRMSGNAKLALQDIFIPQTHAWEVTGHTDRWTNKKAVVNAMEYIESSKKVMCGAEYGKKCNCRYWGEPRICFALALDIIREQKIYDIFWGNVLLDKNNKFWVIDLGCQ